jgi:hypothetical protein
MGVSTPSISRGSTRSEAPLLHRIKEFTSFADELARYPDVEGLLLRLRHGHNRDRHGWCDHPSHTYRWERHPCSSVRLADLVEQRRGR